MKIIQEPFGTTADGKVVERYTLANDGGMRVAVVTYGATITSVETLDRRGIAKNVVLSLDTFDDYLKGHPYFGSTVGRFANRIAKGRFSIDGKEYRLATNNGPNHLHGGNVGFDKVVWKAEPVGTADSVGVAFTHFSPDGDEGYPGNLQVQATYVLTNDNELRMEFSAETDRTTVVNLTNHAYWNLTGELIDVLGHELMLNADGFLPVDKNLIPLGEVQSVKNTLMDFTVSQTLGSRIARVEGGFDHCFALNKTGESQAPALAARVFEPHSGRAMDVWTTQPGVQLYTCNFLDGTFRRGGAAFQKHFAFCLETQHYPDSPNQPCFPTTLLNPSEKYQQATIHKFYTR
jgi:aldose 1-epimerase